MDGMENLQTEHRATLYRLKWIFLLIFQIPAIILTLIIFVYFIKHPHRLKDIRHQGLLLLLVVNFIQLTCDLPMPIHFYRFGLVQPATSIYCTWWTFVEYSLDIIIALLTMMISIHRHLLIFHDRILQNRLKRSIFYYLPLLICIIYPLIVYTNLILLHPCDGTQWDYTLNVCGFANCYLLYNKSLATYDWIAHNGFPTMIIILANVALVIRVIRQKHRHQRRLNWRKSRGMTLQLLKISFLFMIAWLPSLVIGLVQQTINPTFAVSFQTDYALDCIYLMCLFLPWICFLQVSGLSAWIFFRLNRLREYGRINIVRPA